MWTVLGVFGLLVTVFFHDGHTAVLEESKQRKSPSDLRRDIFKNYDSKTIPVKNPGEQVYTGAAMTFIFLREVMEDKEILVVDGWLSLKWNDSYLTWNPEDYGGIKSLNVPSDDVWKPDVTAYTASPDMKVLPQVATKAIVYSGGEVLWVPPLTITSRCPMDFRNYPNDVQRCLIRLGSWTYSDSSIDLQLYSPSVDLTHFTDNNQEWTLVSVTVERKDNYYPCCPNEDYPSIDYNITIKRRRAPNLFIADTVSYFAVFSSLLMFWLPPDAVHKVIIGIIAELLLGSVAMYLGLSLKAPIARTKATERLLPFMWIVAVSMVIETFIVNLARVMGPCRPPRCVVAIAKGCCQPFCVCVSRPYPGGDLRSEMMHSDKKKHLPSAQEEWNIVAMAFDRILFVAALLTSVFCYYVCK